MPGNESIPLLSGFKWARISLRIAALMVVAMLLGLFTGNEVMVGLCGAGLLLALIFAFVGSLTAWRARPVLQRMVAGDHYVHWQYAGAEWEKHLAAEKKRNTRMIVWMIGIVALLLLMIAIMIGIETHYRVSQGMEARDLAYWLHWMIPLSIPVSVLLVVGVIVDAVEKSQRETLRREGGRVYIGREGIYYCGEFWPSARSPIQYCERVSIEEGDPASLVFSFRMLNLRHSPASTSTQTSYRVIHVPVPAGHDAEARVVLDKVLQDWFPRSTNG